MEFEQIKQAAWQQKPDEITGCFERCAYLSMQNLYDLFRRKIITQEQAQKQAAEIEADMVNGIKIRDMYLLTCQMRIALAGISQKVDPNQCPILKIIDERNLNIDEADLQSCVSCLREGI